MTGRKIDAMHQRYGRDPEQRRCGACPHFTRTTPTDRSFFKCDIYGNTASVSSDWRKNYTACSLIDAPDFQQDRPVIHCLPRTRPEPEQIPGQITIDEAMEGGAGC